MSDDAETLAILDPDVTITLRDPDTGAAVDIYRSYAKTRNFS